MDFCVSNNILKLMPYTQIFIYVKIQEFSKENIQDKWKWKGKKNDGSNDEFRVSHNGKN